ncbi:hypothetical protein AMTR_s00012p00032410 [Amborella trichopoda]|uniref:Uncharacterized protein n=1 Tax=Amborella trichopoda TaxID=13333 RepID=W1PCT4_AMBTC|nr:hypothetical protein AMTR_s00012p00032410 [Amborella trichopoda]
MAMDDIHNLKYEPLKTTKEILQKLEADYATPSFTRRVMAKKHNSDLLMKGRKLTENIQNFRTSIGELEAADIKLDEKMLVRRLLNTMPSSWEAFISISTLSAQECTPKLDKIITKLKAGKDKRIDRDTPATYDSTKAQL